MHYNDYQRGYQDQRLAIPASISVAEAIDILEEMHAQDTTVLPGLSDTLEEIRVTAERLDITTVSRLIERHAALLTALTGTHTITAYLKSDQAAPLHTYRNLIASLAVAAVASFNGPVEHVLTKIATLRTRTTQLRRPFTDDEILLARTAVLALHDPARRRPSHRTVIYALLDAGLYPSETPVVCADSFDAVNDPSLVEAAGNGQVTDRLLLLDEFACQLLGDRLANGAARGEGTKTSLAYKPNKGTYTPNGATASVQGVANRFLGLLGLLQDDVTATSITTWRLQHIYRTEGLDAALYASGRRFMEQLLRLINVTPETVKHERAREQVDFLGG